MFLSRVFTCWMMLSYVRKKTNSRWLVETAVDPALTGDREADGKKKKKLWRSAVWQSLKAREASLYLMQRSRPTARYLDPCIVARGSKWSSKVPCVFICVLSLLLLVVVVVGVLKTHPLGFPSCCSQTPGMLWREESESYRKQYELCFENTAKDCMYNIKPSWSTL